MSHPLSLKRRLLMGAAATLTVCIAAAGCTSNTPDSSSGEEGGTGNAAAGSNDETGETVTLAGAQTRTVGRGRLATSITDAGARSLLPTDAFLVRAQQIEVRPIQLHDLLPQGLRDRRQGGPEPAPGSGWMACSSRASGSLDVFDVTISLNWGESSLFFMPFLSALGPLSRAALRGGSTALDSSCEKNRGVGFRNAGGCANLEADPW